MFHKRILLGLCIVGLMAASALAQGGTGQISGTVTDPNGAVVSGASVKIVNTSTNLARNSTTNEDGVYTFTLLPAGTYSVEVSSQGFQAYKATAVVNVAQTTAIDTQLSVSGGEVTVDVQAPTLQIETS